MTTSNSPNELLSFVNHIDDRALGDDTRCLEISTRPCHYDGLSPPIAMSSIFQLRSVENSEPSGHMYTRVSNPTTLMLEQQMESLYHFKSDLLSTRHPAVSFASGMAAISCIFHRLTQQPYFGGGTEAAERYVRHVLISDEVYCSVSHVLETISKERGVEFDRFDVRDVAGAVELVRATTCIVYMESCSNPRMKIPDFEELIPRVKERKTERLLESGFDPQMYPMNVVVDNTWLSPTLFNPFRWGADFVVESGSKYLCGSSSAVIGFVLCPESLHRSIAGWRSMMGCQAGPMSAFIVSKGLETLSLRVRRVSRSAIEIAQFLLSLPFVTRAVHPEMPQHPDRQLCRKYFGGGSGVVYFHAFLTVKEGTKFMRETQTVKRTTSFGGTHYSLNIRPKKGDTGFVNWVEREEREDEGEVSLAPRKATNYNYKGTWYRLSVGLTSVEDAKADLAKFLFRHACDELGKISSFDSETMAVSWTFSRRKGDKRATSIPPELPLQVGSLVAFLPTLSSLHSVLVATVVEGNIQEGRLSGCCVVSEHARALAGVDLSEFRLMKVRSVRE